MVLLILLCILTAVDAWAAGAPVRIDEGDTITTKADVTVSTTATLISASNSARATLSCTVSAAVRWGDSTVGTTRGQQVPANATVAIRNLGAVYMIAESDSATVSCTEETSSTSSSTGVFSP